MKKVLFIHSSSELYGSDKSLLYLLQNINKKEYELSVLLPSKGPLVNELEKVDGIKVEIFEVAVLRRKNMSICGFFEYIKDFSKSYKFIKEYIKKNNVDIIYTNTAVVFPGAIVAKNVGIKNIWHIREIINSKLERKFISIIINHYADYIIANSRATGKSICKNDEKLKIIYNAIEDKKNNNSIFSNKDNNIVIGMAGRINRWKGQKFFVDVAEIINEKYPEIKFKIAGKAYSGEEWLENDLEKYINEKRLQNSIELLGQVDDMNFFYNTIDIFILPSIQAEPFGLVIIEAMEMKKPVIATNHGGPTEIIDNGKNGYLVDYKNPIEMAEVCIKLIEDENLRFEIGEAGYKKKKAFFSLEKTVSDIENVLYEL